MRYLLDTDIVIDVFNEKKPSYSAITALIEKKKTIAISLLTITEVRSGWNDRQSKVFLSRLYRMFSIENISQSIAELAGEYRHDYARKGMQLSVVDTILAATAILEDYSFVTRNTKHFPMKELKLYKWK